MRLSKNGIKVLTAQYRAVLKKCLLINMGLFFCAVGAIADDISLNHESKDINGNINTEYKFTGWETNLAESDYGDNRGIDTTKEINDIVADLQKVSEIRYTNLSGKPGQISKLELSDNAVLNLEDARLMIDSEQSGGTLENPINAIFVKDSAINLKNSSLDASTDDGDKIFNTVFDNATLKLVNSELPIDGDVKFTNGSTLSISAPNYFSEEEIIAMLQNKDNAQKIAEAIKGQNPTSLGKDDSGYEWKFIGLPSNVELSYTNSDGTTGVVSTSDMAGEQMVEVMRLTIDNSNFIIGDSKDSNDRARVSSDSQIHILNGSKVVLNNRAVLTFDQDDEDDEENNNPFGKSELVINHSHVTLNDNSELNVANRGNATTTIENNSQIFMNDDSQMNLNAVTITDSQIHMKDNATLTMDSVVLQKAAIHGTGTNKVIIAGENATTFEDTSLEVTDDNAIQVNKNGHFKIQAKNSEVKITGSSADNSVISLEGENGDTTTVDINGSTQGVTIDGAIISANKDNVVNVSGNVNLNGLLDPLTFNVANGKTTHTYYADDIAFNLNNGGTLKYIDDKHLYDSAKHGSKYALNSINFNGGTLDIANGKATDIKLAKLTLSKESNIMLDADLANITMDRFSEDTKVEGTAPLHISKLNLVSDAKNEETKINFTKNEKLLAATDYTGETSGLKALSPVYTYDVAYDNGDFTFTRGGGSSVSDYNPAVYAGSVVGQTLATIQSTISQTAFSALNNTLPQKDNAWVSVIGFDDTVDMKSFSNVDSEMYSVVGGVNSDAKHFDNFDATYGLYVGYLNSEQKYDGNKIEQNGGYIGLDSVLNKGNAELLASVNTGYIRNEDKHSFGTDKFDTYFTGVALKAGYTYNLNNGLSVIPSLYTGYTFVNNEDYTSKSGAKIKNDNLHLFEVAPGVKVNKNFNNGWTGYAQAKYAFIMDNGGDADVNNINLQNISAKDYVEYGLGANKALNDSWSLSAEINRRDGGREGWNGNLNIKYNF